MEGREGPSGSACIGFRLIAGGVISHQIGTDELTSRLETMDSYAQQSVDPNVTSASAALLAASRDFDATGDQSGVAPAIAAMSEACTQAGFAP